MMKNQKGITLVALVFTIIVLMILASIAVYSGVSTIRYARYNKAKSEMEIMQANVNEWYQEYISIEVKDEEIPEGKTEYEVKVEKQQSLIEKYGVEPNDENLTPEQLYILGKTAEAVGIDFYSSQSYKFFSENYLKENFGMNASFDFLVDIPSRTVILFGGLVYNGEKYFRADQFGILNVGFEPDSILFTLEQGNKKNIIISDLKLFDSNAKESNISKFLVQYRRTTDSNWSDATEKVTKYTRTENDTTVTKYRFEVPDYDEYIVRILTTDKSMERSDSVNVEFIANEPKLSDSMIPIKYDTIQKKWIVCEEDDEEWYSYTETDKKWANIMLLDGKYKATTAKVGTVVEDNELGSMFVWIPRYAYSISKFKTAANDEGTTQKITDVTFLSGTTDKDISGNTYETDYDIDLISVGEATPKIVHPAFTFGETKLTGIWSAKFEVSMKETNNNTEANNNVTDKTIKILPNAESWRYISIGNMFLNCLNMKNNSIYGLPSSSDTHLIKNIEWGALVYLAASQYGFTPTMNTDVQIHTGQNDYRSNKSQSTTGNETGIYDLNGGAYERVAAYWDNGHSNLSENGTSTLFLNNKLKSSYEKYWDKYEVSQNEITQVGEKLEDKDYTYNNMRKSIADDRYSLMKNIKGDAMNEVINEYSYSGKYSNSGVETEGWLSTVTDRIPTSQSYKFTYYNGDAALIGNTSRVFLTRGGGFGSDSYAGIFFFSTIIGYAGYYNGFRPVLVIE